MYKYIITNETMLGFKMKFKQYNNEKKEQKKVRVRVSKG